MIKPFFVFTATLTFALAPQARAKAASAISLYLANGGLNWQLLVPEYQKYYAQLTEEKEVVLSPYSNCMDCLELTKFTPDDFSRPPRHDPGKLTITRIDVWHDRGQW